MLSSFYWVAFKFLNKNNYLVNILIIVDYFIVSEVNESYSGIFFPGKYFSLMITWC